MLKIVEYIWLDGLKTPALRSKTRILERNEARQPGAPDWDFDSSSTGQGGGENSDRILRPVCSVPNPTRRGTLSLCEVLNVDGTPHATNKRAKLRAVLNNGASAHDVWFGIEQEYTLFKDGRPLGWPLEGEPAPQGPYYCGVGTGKAFGRPLVEEHMQACIDAGLLICGINAEVMPGQWEFQIGPRVGTDEDELPAPDALLVSDHLWLARWLLERLGENYGITPSLANKPMQGDWNGAGAHTNFSTKKMRNWKTGAVAAGLALEALAAAHNAHIPEYGEGLDQRLSGRHETSSIDQFSHGISDRGASVRTPRSVAAKGCGYLEDRRPGANCDPYRVCAKILETVCGV